MSRNIDGSGYGSAEKAHAKGAIAAAKKSPLSA